VNGSVSIRRTLSLAGITIIDTGGARSRRLYPIADHLGSPIAIADGTGHLVQGLAYADFGKRYSAGWAAVLTTGQAISINTTLSDRGYTGQESLDAIGLDDYNARLGEALVVVAREARGRRWRSRCRRWRPDAVPCPDGSWRVWLARSTRLLACGVLAWIGSMSRVLRARVNGVSSPA